MLRDEDTIILSEIKDFFTSREKAIGTILGFLGSLTISDKRLSFPQAVNQQYSNYAKLCLLLLFPFFDIKTVYHYSYSALYNFMRCSKDTFYRLMNNSGIWWREIGYRLNKQLICKAERESDSKGEKATRCLIIDDTDLPKSGHCMELIGRIWSHVTQTSILGLKGLFMGNHDGKNFFSLDFSLHGEKAKMRKSPMV